MPNWCEGTLKVRGKLKDVEQWVKENVSVFHSDFVKDQNGKIKGIEEVKIPDGVKVENSDGEVLEITISEDAYIAETRRHFVQPGTYFALLYQKNYLVLCMDFKAAWTIIAEPFAEMSKKYNVDFRLYGCECGMEFCQNVIVEHGKIVKDEEIIYNDYEWECPFPKLGG